MLGNVGAVENVSALEHAPADPEPLVREHAAWALGCLAALRADTGSTGPPR